MKCSCVCFCDSLPRLGSWSSRDSCDSDLGLRRGIKSLCPIIPCFLGTGEPCVDVCPEQLYCFAIRFCRPHGDTTDFDGICITYIVYISIVERICSILYRSCRKAKNAFSLHFSGAELQNVHRSMLRLTCVRRTSLPSDGTVPPIPPDYPEPPRLRNPAEGSNVVFRDRMSRGADGADLQFSKLRVEHGQLNSSNNTWGNQKHISHVTKDPEFCLLQFVSRGICLTFAGRPVSELWVSRCNWAPHQHEK